jgi:hypothetical protein
VKWKLFRKRTESTPVVSADTKKPDKIFMKKRPFSSLPPQDRFLAYVIIMIIIAAIFVFAVYMAIVIREKIRMSDDISKQRASPVAASPNDGNGLDPAVTLNAENGASTNDAPTNAMTPLPVPVISDTNSN